MENSTYIPQQPPVQPAIPAPRSRRKLWVCLFAALALLMVVGGTYTYQLRSGQMVASATVTEEIAAAPADKAKAAIEDIKREVGIPGEVVGNVESFGGTGYGLDYDGQDADLSQRLNAYLGANFSLASGFMTERSEGYESGPVLCVRADPRRYDPATTPDSSSSIWCTDRRAGGEWQVEVPFGDISGIDQTEGIISATVWGAPSMIHVVGIEDEHGSVDGDLSDLSSTVSKNPSSSVLIVGTWKDGVLQTSSMDWVRG